MLAYCVEEVFQALKALLEPYHVVRYDTDDWRAYQRHLDSDKHEVGKRNTLCFSKLELWHDTVIGLLINKVEFGLDIHA